MSVMKVSPRSAVVAALVLISVLVASSSAAPTSAAQGPGSVGVSRSMSGHVLLVQNLTIDFCEASGQGSCPVNLDIWDNSSLAVTLAITTGSAVLDAGSSAAVSGTIEALNVSESLVLNFSRGGSSFVYSHQVAAPTSTGKPESSSFSVPVGALTSALGLPPSSVNASLEVSEALDISGSLEGTGFANTAPLLWAGSSDGEASEPFIGRSATATLELGPLASTKQWELNMSTSGSSGPRAVFGVAANDTVASTQESGLFAWHQVTVTSRYSSASGSGWYLAGTNATVSSPQSVVDVQNTSRMAFAGWNGTGQGSYSGVDLNATVNVRSPVSEVALWQKQYAVSVLHSTGGVVYLQEEGWLYQPLGDSWVSSGSQLYLQATPRPGYTFEGWVVNGTALHSSPPVLDETVLGPLTVRAEFAAATSPTTTATSPRTPHSFPVVPALSVLGALVAAIVAAFAILMRRRRKHQSQESPPRPRRFFS